MNLVICSIHDSKAEAWINPMTFQSRAQAVRSFSDAIQDGQSEFSKHPEDYSLFMLGEFDQRTGELVLEASPVNLGNGINYKSEA